MTDLDADAPASRHGHALLTMVHVDAGKLDAVLAQLKVRDDILAAALEMARRTGQFWAPTIESWVFEHIVRMHVWRQLWDMLA